MVLWRHGSRIKGNHEKQYITYFKIFLQLFHVKKTAVTLVIEGVGGEDTALYQRPFFKKREFDPLVQ